MSLLGEIQEAVVQEGTSIAPILLKLRLLAARLGSAELEEWVKFESEGYPSDAHLPDYRRIPVTYSATFFGPFGGGIKNAQIPPYLIKQIAGEHWCSHEMRQSVAAVDELITSTSGEGGSLQIRAADLILLLQGKVYEDYACNDVTGRISRASLAELQHAVRSRVLELTIELEKSIPHAVEVTFGNAQPPEAAISEKVTQISNQVVYGNFTSISSTGSSAHISVQLLEGDTKSFTDFLVENGLDSIDATELSEIVASEEPGDKKEPLGAKATAWLAENLKKATDGTWKVGISVATEVIKKAALKYYGLD